jgi:hypothetical protein
MMMMKVLITMMAMISVSMAAKQKLHNGAEIKPVAGNLPTAERLLLFFCRC